MTQPAISVQLYSCRDHLDDLDTTLGRLGALGLRHVEAFAYVEDPTPLAEALQRHGMTAPTGHAPMLSDELTFGGRSFPVPSLDAVFAASRAVGVELVIDPMTDASRWTTEDGVRDIAQRLNEVARRAADAGLRVGYHNHNQELLPRLRGVTALEFFADLLDDAVSLEVDVYWAATGDVDVPVLLRRLGDRVHALHVKDGRLGRRDLPLEALATRPQLPAGQGDLPLADILAAAPNVETVVIEFDAFDGDVFDGIAQSHAYLTKLLT